MSTIAQFSDADKNFFEVPTSIQHADDFGNVVAHTIEDDVRACGAHVCDNMPESSKSSYSSPDIFQRIEFGIASDGM